MRRDNFTPSKQSKLCSKHFTSGCYNINPSSSQKKLKDNAIPSIFDFPTSFKKDKNPRKPPANRQQNTSVNNLNDSLQ